ncbi:MULTISPECIES: gene transfer agent family protein [unclassified Chelatococcus]|uniref:gene transfer agent family protein n=1 Tax=unclassified Chelatococcus TaxID=2638111 RepID=UPI0002EAA63A|nr:MULTISPECIES: gene transfer agent family protein [unclassified Chelatococcus]ALA18301.1 hypothetical protein AL346_13925 [Chelatococcus sp. CO-6]
MANLRRGEITAEIGGETFVLCLTLGALAELEDAFGVEDLAGLGERFARGRLSAGDMIRLISAAIRGGGRAMSDREVAALPIGQGLENLAAIIARLLAVTFGPGEASPPNP